MLTHVNYRTGAMHDMAAITSRARPGHSVRVGPVPQRGAVPVDLNGAGADFPLAAATNIERRPRRTGLCGAPAHVQPPDFHGSRLSGLVGPPAPFLHARLPARPGITRYLCGTQPIISLSPCNAGWMCSPPHKAWAAWRLRTKSLALTDLFIQLVEERCAGYGLGLATRVITPRGSQVCLTRDEGAGVNGQDSSAYAIVQALIARGVIGDWRLPRGSMAAWAVARAATRTSCVLALRRSSIGFEDVCY